MAKRIKIEDKYYRYRDGKLVEIPSEWVGKVPNGNKMRQRNPVKRRTRKNKNKST